MKPNLSFTTGKESIASPVDISTGKSFTVKRDLRTKSASSTAANDALTINKSGYDEFISKKGVNSAVPTVLSIVPLKQREVEKSIINIQHTLNKTTLTDVQNIIMNTTSSFSQNELAEFDAGFTDNFKGTVEKISAVYKAKADYLSFISNLTTLATSDVETWILLNPVIESKNSSYTIDFSVKNTSGIKSSLTLDTWLKDELHVNDIAGRFNITKMLQALRNSYAMLRMGDISSVQSTDSTFKLEKVKNDVYEQSVNFLNSIYDKSITLSNSSLEQMIDNSLSILSKDVSLQFSSGFSGEGENVKSQFASLLGNVAKHNYEQDLTSDKNSGVFFDLLNQKSNNKFVLSIDNNLTSQDSLSKYINADQHYLIGPLSTNLKLMNERLTEFQGNYQKIYDGLNSLKSKMQLNNDARVFFAFFKSLSSYCDKTFMTEIPAHEMLNSMTRFLIFQQSITNFDLLRSVLRIMMFRDRLRNAQDYEQDETKADVLRAKSKAQIKGLCKKIALSQFGLKEGAKANTYSPDDLCISNASKIFTSKIGGTSSTLDDSPQTIELTDTQIRDAYQDLFDALIVEDYTQFDIFYDAAKSLEGTGYSITSTQMTNDDPLTAKVGIVDQFINSNRDHRAITFFIKAMLWFKNLQTIDGNASFYCANSLSNNAYSSTDSGASSVVSTLTVQFNYDVTFFARMQAIIDTLISLPNVMTSQDLELARKTATFKSVIDSNKSIKSDIEKEATTLATTLGFTNYENVTISDKGTLELIETLTDEIWTLYDKNIAVLLDSILKPVIKKSQYVYETFEYMTNYLSKTISLLEIASSAASSYISSYGENISTLYTNNALSLLKNIEENGLNTTKDLNLYTRSMFQDDTYLKGMLTYANNALPNTEDSFVVIVGIPYGMLERMGSYRQNIERNVNVKLTFRDINLGTKTIYELTTTYPASSFINEYTQKYSTNDYASNNALIDATNLFYLDINESIIIDDFTSNEAKTNELKSKSVIEYLKILYGIDFSQQSFVQNDNVNVDSDYINTKNSIEKVTTTLKKLNLDDLILSRYTNAVSNSAGFKKSTLQKQALQGPVFDKIIAIPIDGDLLRASNIEYLNDMITTIDMSFGNEITQNTIDIQRTISVRG